MISNMSAYTGPRTVMAGQSPKVFAALSAGGLGPIPKVDDPEAYAAAHGARVLGYWVQCEACDQPFAGDWESPQLFDTASAARTYATRECESHIDPETGYLLCRVCHEGI